MLYHYDCKYQNLYYTSDYHQHNPGICNHCLNCKTDQPCILNNRTFLCNLTTQVYDEASQTFNQLVYHDQSLLREHIQPMRLANLFYICFTHKHYHRNHKSQTDSSMVPSATCTIQTTKCCDQALLLTEFSSSFNILYTMIPTNKNTPEKPKEYLIYDPSIWKNQSINKFICFVRALLDRDSSLELIDSRYKAFTNASFTTPQLSIYKSGKFSLARTCVTGFETHGLYQTSIMSETIPDNVVLIPGVLYDMVSERFDMSLVAVKRDPVFYNTSLAVFTAKRNVDDTVKTFVFPYGWGIPFHQDIDGDKNTIYFLAKKKAGFDFTQSFDYKLSKYELGKATQRKLSMLATSRYSLSENVRFEIFSNGEAFLQDDTFWQQTKNYGPQFMADAGASYLKAEFEQFKIKLRARFAMLNLRLLTIDDVLMKTTKLRDFVISKSKGNTESINLFEKSMRQSALFNDSDRMAACISQYNNYSQGNQHLRHHGKEQFIAFYSMQDVVTLANLVYLNKKVLADLSPFPGFYTYVFTEAALICFKNDLFNAFNKEV